jgi:hypothetical protein
MLRITTLGEQLRRKLLPGMSIPEPFELLFGWIEDNGLFIDTDGGRLGFLFSRDKLEAEQTETARPGGTDISFFAEGNAHLKYWFGHERSEIVNQLRVFAKTGTTAQWLPSGWMTLENSVSSTSDRVRALPSSASLRKMPSISCVSWPLDMMKSAGAKSFRSRPIRRVLGHT